MSPHRPAEDSQATPPVLDHCPPHLSGQHHHKGHRGRSRLPSLSTLRQAGKSGHWAGERGLGGQRAPGTGVLSDSTENPCLTDAFSERLSKALASPGVDGWERCGGEAQSPSGPQSALRATRSLGSIPGLLLSPRAPKLLSCLPQDPGPVPGSSGVAFMMGAEQEGGMWREKHPTWGPCAPGAWENEAPERPEHGPV